MATRRGLFGKQSVPLPKPAPLHARSVFLSAPSYLSGHHEPKAPWTLVSFAAEFVNLFKRPLHTVKQQKGNQAAMVAVPGSLLWLCAGRMRPAMGRMPSLLSILQRWTGVQGH